MKVSAIILLLTVAAVSCQYRSRNQVRGGQISLEEYYCIVAPWYLERLRAHDPAPTTTVPPALKRVGQWSWEEYVALVQQRYGFTPTRPTKATTTTINPTTDEATTEETSEIETTEVPTQPSSTEASKPVTTQMPTTKTTSKQATKSTNTKPATHSTSAAPSKATATEGVKASSAERE